MKKSKFSDEQITYALRQVDSGTPVGQLRDENARLRRLVADLTLDKHILGEVGRKKL